MSASSPDMARPDSSGSPARGQRGECPSLRGETILCIAPRRWDSLWKETQAIMSRLAVDNTVLYVEPGRDPEHGVLSEMRRNWRNLFRPTVPETCEGVVVIGSPPSMPHGRRHLPARVLRSTIPIVTAMNARLLVRRVRHAMAGLGVTSPILWLTDPYHLHLVGRFGEKLTCYFNFDEFSEMVGNRRVRALVRRLDDELTRRVDVVFATSQSQCDRRRAINPQTHLVPNGVDFARFARAAAGEPLPPDVASLPHPILGFVGWLTSHLDAGLLRRASEAYPHCSLVLIGPGELPRGHDRAVLLARRNVVCLGKKDHALIPAYLRAFDVALMPYSLVGHVAWAYPAKLHEYLAAGVPVVATALPELRPFAHVVRLAATPDDFVRMIASALEDRSSDAVDARRAVAAENTWEQRVAAIGAIVVSLLRQRVAPT